MTRRMVKAPCSMAEYLADQKNRKRLQTFRDLLTSLLEMAPPEVILKETERLDAAE
jgi:hypothetical protein